MTSWQRTLKWETTMIFWTQILDWKNESSRIFGGEIDRYEIRLRKRVYDRVIAELGGENEPREIGGLSTISGIAE